MGGGFNGYGGMRGGLSTREVTGGTVTAGSAWPRRPPPPSPPFWAPAYWQGPPLASHGTAPRATRPGQLPQGGGAARQPHRGGGGGAIFGAPLATPPGTVSGARPGRTAAPLGPPPCLPQGDGADPLPPAGLPPRSGAAPADGDRGSTRARHWGARRLAVLARPPHLCGPACFFRSVSGVIQYSLSPMLSTLFVA